jgi:hypothetical protein
MPDEGYTKIQVGGHRRNSKRYEALVDNVDAEAMRAYRWSTHCSGYARRTIRVEGKQLDVFMHRELLGLAADDPREVDHVNGNKLDNRRENLRPCTDAQNKQNLHERPHRGTTWDAERNLWMARAELDYKRHNLGRYTTQEEATAAAAAFRRANMPYSSDAREGV